jgi:hypothetical protein
MADAKTGNSPAEKQATPARAGKLTRAQVAARLGVSLSKVRTMEGRTLHPTIVDGVHYFARDEVDHLALSGPALPRGRARLDDGQIAARVFRLIDQGKELREIVEELEVPPRVIRDLYREWKTDFDEGEQQRRRAEQEASDRRRSEELQREADKQTRDFERVLRGLQGR